MNERKRGLSLLWIEVLSFSIATALLRVKKGKVTSKEKPPIIEFETNARAHFTHFSSWLPVLLSID
jgi:hypothetical protein